MTFAAYLDNIRLKTGNTPEDFHRLALEAGLLTPDLTATTFTAWLKREFALGHGHAMAIWAVFKDKGWVEPKKTATPKALRT